MTTAEWREKVEADLKGAPFDKKLVWRTNEGFNVQPMYRAEDIENLSTTDSLPGEYPFVRGTRTDNDWLASVRKLTPPIQSPPMPRLSTCSARASRRLDSV